MLSLDPFGKPVPDLPLGVTDYATAVRVHGDQIVPERNPGPALAGQSVAQILAACAQSAAMQGVTSTDRVLSTASWERPELWWTDCWRCWPPARRWSRWPIPTRRRCSAASTPKR